MFLGELQQVSIRVLYFLEGDVCTLALFIWCPALPNNIYGNAMLTLYFQWGFAPYCTKRGFMFITSEISKENKGKLNNKTDGIIFTPMHHVRNIPYRCNVYAGYSPHSHPWLLKTTVQPHTSTCTTSSSSLLGLASKMFHSCLVKYMLHTTHCCLLLHYRSQSTLAKLCILFLSVTV